MTHTVRILQPAQEDLLEIYEYIASESPPSAVKMVHKILDRIESLSHFPNRGAQPRDPRLKTKGYRFVTEKPYLVFYKIGPSQVWVHRVLHGKRAYNRIL